MVRGGELVVGYGQLEVGRMVTSIVGGCQERGPESTVSFLELNNWLRLSNQHALLHFISVDKKPGIEFLLYMVQIEPHLIEKRPYKGSSQPSSS